MSETNKLEDQLTQCFSKLLNKNVLNKDLVTLLDAVW